eukprot:5357611-Amphidinium_carterae.1
MPVSVKAVEDFVVAQNSSVAWKPFAISACTAVPTGSLCASGTAFYIALMAATLRVVAGPLSVQPGAWSHLRQSLHPGLT